jgi:transposase
MRYAWWCTHAFVSGRIPLVGLREGTLQRLPAEAREYIATIEQEADQWHTRHRSLQLRYDHLQEEYRLLVHKRFGRSSEREENEDQRQLFEEAELGAEDEVVAGGEITVERYTRTKRGRKPIDEHVPRVEIVHDIPEEEKRCACGHGLVRIGEETTERLQVIPEQIYAERHIRPKYACRNCEGSGDEEKPAVRIAAAPASVLPGSIVTPGLLAFIIVNKYVDHLPLYRQEKRFERLGIRISRQDMSNWIVALGGKVSPLIDRMQARIREGPLINMDETRLQVLGEPGRENTSDSYMWLSRGGDPRKPVCLYQYHQRRTADHPSTVLNDYEGYLQTDGYEVYDQVTAGEPGITLVGCWAHARRKFFEAGKATKHSGAAHEGLKRIRGLYRIEKELRERELPDKQFVAERRAKVEPELEAFKTWLTKKSETVVPSSLLGKAVGYTLNQWEKLVRYLDLAILTPDNNAAENAIRPFVVGRKNFLFSGSPRGAHASCAFFSLIETAKNAGLNPYAYLHYLFTRMPHIASDDDWDALLPSRLDAETVNSAMHAGVR